MGAKKLDRDLLNRIREKFEAGYNLYDLANENFLNYDTLKNISSQEGWQKNSRVEAIRIAEINLESEKNAKTRQTVKNKYKSITNNLRAELVGQSKKGITEDRDKAEAILKSIQAVGELYKIDKDLHNIMNSKEEADIQQKRLKNQKLKEDLLQDDKPPHIT
ncbi:MAG: hypothetical protein JW924_11890 [Fusobacteriaceae bacterium]|nr:hypothetical protein [Fusobacteriaceae bacterium]